MNEQFSTAHFLEIRLHYDKVPQNQGSANALPTEFVMQLSKLGQSSRNFDRIINLDAENVSASTYSPRYLSQSSGYATEQTTQNWEISKTARLPW